MGFTRCIIPRSNLKNLAPIEGLEAVGVGSVAQAVETLF
jgi:hypothetical protein